MDPKRARQVSKQLSYVLRHAPEALQLELDASGWIGVEALLAALNEHGTRLERAVLEQVVRDNPKQRFAFNADATPIRANQGHSIEVDLSYTPTSPPGWLYHGTAERFVPTIRAEGLVKGKRHHVHLSAAREVAQTVGARRGRAVVLEIAAGEMESAGFEFFVSPNGVWLTTHVPARFIR